MSVPRPAMFVEMVTAPSAPARGDDAASWSSCFALRTAHEHAPCGDRGREPFGLGDGRGPDENGPTGRMRTLDLVDDRPFLGFPMRVDHVGRIDPPQWQAGREDGHGRP